MGTFFETQCRGPWLFAAWYALMRSQNSLSPFNRVKCGVVEERVDHGRKVHVVKKDVQLLSDESHEAWRAPWMSE